MLPTVKIPTPSLRQRSTEVNQKFLLQEETKSFIQDLIATMYRDDGIGIASPQVGKNIRICIIGKEATLEKKKDLILANPIWQKTSRKKVWDVEGCLSVPKTFGKVQRYKDVYVEAFNENGEKITFEAHDFFARVVQHEVDHLDGILFIDKAKDIYNN